MARPKKSDDAAEKNGRPTGRLERQDGGMQTLEGRTLAFQMATQRKGMPITYGTGVPRTDAAWKRDQEYNEEG